MLLDLISWISLLCGSIFLVVGSIGLLRFPDLFTRLHAASVVDTFSVFLIMFGAMLQAGLSIVLVKLICIVLFVLFTSPVAAHALAKAALYDGVKPVLNDSGESLSNS